MSEIISRETGEIMDIITQDENGKLTVAKEVISAMVAIEEQNKELKKQYDVYRQALKDAMEKHGITKIDADDITVNYIEESAYCSLDAKRLEVEYPKIYRACTIYKGRKAHVKVRLK